MYLAQWNGMTIKIILNDRGNPAGKLADAELHFTDGALAGLKLIGFSVWERRTSTGRNVTFPARQYQVNGDRRSFALLRPIGEAADCQARVRDLILEAYEAHVAQTKRLGTPAQQAMLDEYRATVAAGEER